MKLPSVQQVYAEAWRAVRRFPLALLCAVILAITAVIAIESEPHPESSVPHRALLAGLLGLPLLAALALDSEKRKWPPILSAVRQFLGVLLLIAYAFSLPANLLEGPAAPFIRFGLLLAGLVLLLMILPYLKKGELNGFWQYNKSLIFRLFVTAIFSAVLFAGLAIALAALDNLFGVYIPDRRYAELWALVAALFAPWFFLSGVPENLDVLEGIEEYPKGLKAFAQYILMSLVIVYLVILYAYLFKILLQWSWPKGWVSSLILGFSATSIISLLLMHPIRDRVGNAWIRVAGKWLYIVSIPPIVVLFLAVTERIGDYGITESRYVGIALAIWLSAQVLYFLFSRSKSIKFTVGSLCLVAFLTCFGPWGMLGVSQHSQVGRLSRLLTKNEILIDGKVQKEHGSVSQDDARQISSIVMYLSQVHGYDAIRPWFGGERGQDLQSPEGRMMRPSDVLQKMGVEYIASQGSPSARTFILNPKMPVDISGYERVLVQHDLKEGQPPRFEGDGISYEASDGLKRLTVRIGDPQLGFDSVEIDIGAFAEKTMREHGNDSASAAGSMSPEAMTIVAEQNGHRAKLIFRKLTLIRRNGSVTISSFTVDFAYTLRTKE